MVDSLLRSNIGPKIVFGTLDLHVSSVRPSRRVSLVGAVVFGLSVRPSRRPSRRRRPYSVRPSRHVPSVRLSVLPVIFWQPSGDLPVTFR